jgi:putative CocE/NonD family hydrolase
VTWAGEADFGPASTLDGNIAADYLSHRLAWFDRWLKDVETAGAAPRAGVTWFQMGGGSGARDANGRLQHGGRWRHSVGWPPPGSAPLRLYFSPGGGLDAKAPGGEEAFLEYRYDPSDPLPTIGGALTSGEPVMEGGAFDQRLVEGVFRYRADAPNGPLADRADVLVFQTAPLDQDLVVTGSVLAELWVASDCPDTDFTFRLIDVYPPSDDFPQGFTMNITDGILRARYREGWDSEVEMTPGVVYRLEVTALPTSNLFRAGHRLRVDISSSSYPQFDINPNSGLHAEPGEAAKRIAHNRVYCDRLHPSSVCLTVRRDDGRSQG